MTSRRPKIALVDYGAGNLRSVAKALERSSLEPVITGDPAVVRDLDGVLLPGVGAFRDAVTALENAGLVDAIRDVTENRSRPYLGICFGLQLLFDEGEEHGRTPGLGILSGKVSRFPEKDESGEPLVVPHIGWNEVRFTGDHPMIEALPERAGMVFVLHDIEGFKHREIAEMMTISAGSSKSQLFRARALLRDRLTAGRPQ